VNNFKPGWIRRLSSAWLVAVVLMPAAPALPAEVNLPNSPVRVFRVRNLEPPDEDTLKLSPLLERVIEFSIRLYRSQDGGRPIYKFEREDRTGEGDRIHWSFMLEPEQLGVLRVEKKITSRSGQVVAGSFYDFRDPMYNFPRNLAYIYTVVPALQAMDLKVGARHDLYLLLSLDQSPWHMFVAVDGRETVTVPAGTFPCYRIRLEPDYKNIMGKWSWASSLLKLLVPDYTFWVEEAPPHYLVRFEGKFGPTGTVPTQAYELISVLPPPGGSL
jgi:hypothetical protein